MDATVIGLSIQGFLSSLAQPWIFAAFGLCIGSFLNVVIHRKPRMAMREWVQDSAACLEIDPAPHLEKHPEMTLSRPRSTCPSCGHQIRWYENIPVLSWLALRGRCSACGTRISIRYPLVELATAGLFWASATLHPQMSDALMWSLFWSVVLAAALIDMDTCYLLDDLTLPLMWAGLAWAAWQSPQALNTAVWGAMIGYLSLRSVHEGFLLLTGKEGMGHGDFKLLAAFGAWMSAWALLPIVLASCVAGLCWAVVQRVRRTAPSDGRMPFGPFLALGALLVWSLTLPRVMAWLGLPGL